MTAPLAPEGFALTCQTCGFRPDPDVKMGVLAAHFETEHQTADVRLDLVAVCPRDNALMVQTHSAGAKTWWDCPVCRRTRVVNQDPRS